MNIRDVRATILTEAGPGVGLGHLSRCVAIYDALEEQGAACGLVVAGEAPEHIVEARSVRVLEWRSVGEVLSAVDSSDIVVIDSYMAELEVYRAVADAVDAPLYFDDTGRLAYPAGIIVNGSPAACAQPLEGRADQVLLLGTRYHVMRREFWAPERRVTRPQIHRVLVVAGGTDIAGALVALSDIAAEVFPRATIDIVDSPRSAAQMLEASQAADVALTTAGQTLYELACAGTPSVAITVAENQVPQAQAFASGGASLYAGAWGGVSDDRVRYSATEALTSLASQARREALSAAGQRLVDGGGAIRVARLSMGRAIRARIELHPATAADEEDLLGVANDERVREMSFSTERISPQDHHRWMCRVLADPSVLLLVARERGRIMGQVRFDIADTSAVISISIAEQYRGLRLGGHLLELAVDALRPMHPGVDVLKARVRAQNTASRRLFEASGFVASKASQRDAPDVVEYWRPLQRSAVADAL